MYLNSFQLEYRHLDDQSLKLGFCKLLWDKSDCSLNGMTLKYEHYLNNIDSKRLKSISYGFIWGKKFFFVGLELTDCFANNFNRLSIDPNIGIGYKFLWLNYSYRIKIYQKNKMNAGFNDVSLMLVIPLVK
jgi:hypothetical protein